MATKDERPTLLSKVAMFVRNPTKDWSELDRPQLDEESGYDKQALKAMIERKRQNDFVRRREFDQLRKLRSRDASVVAAMGRPSLFQSSSIATDQDGRAVTLKKIDEIEAQMSKQWWKGKQEAGGLPAAAAPVVAPTAAPVRPASTEDLPSVSISLLSDHFATTASPVVANDPVGDFLATEMGAGMTPAGAADAPQDRARARSPGHPAGGAGFSTSRLFAVDDGELTTDPELEEAAIRFANGDDAGAEKGLLDALRGSRVAPTVALSWAAALLDLHRATADHARFDQVLQEFSSVLGGARPAWARIGDPVDMPVAELKPGATDPPLWECPAELTAQAMEELREALGSNPMPWHLGWSQVTAIHPEAMPLLMGLFSSLCHEPVALRFTAPECLLRVLRVMMPSGNRSVDPAWWSVRLDMLCVLRMQDEFEMAALDYCVTYEVAPPAWVEARCQYVSGAARGATDGPGVGGANDGASTLELRGTVVGDATQALAGLGGAGRKGDRIVVGCHGLLRVDFAAAGSILNWVALRQAEGCQVQFRDVHRLVAAFFYVIGINEYAQVVPRPM